MDLYYNTAKLILRVYQRILRQDCSVNWEQPPSPGAKIIACNHPNATDGFYLPFLFKEKLHFFIQGDLFKLPFFGWILEKSKQIPVLPGQKIKALERACELLSGGKTVVIFPEGQLNPDHKSVKTGTGAVRLSLMTSAPIIPVGFYVHARNVRKFKIKKKNSPGVGHWQTSGRCYIQFGCPWSPRQEMSDKMDDSLLHDLTARLMERIEIQAHRAILAFFHDNHLPVPALTNRGFDE